MDHILFYWLITFVAGFSYAFTRRASLLQWIVLIAAMAPILVSSTVHIYETDSIADHTYGFMAHVLHLLSVLGFVPGLALGTLLSKNWMRPVDREKAST